MAERKTVIRETKMRDTRSDCYYECSCWWVNVPEVFEK
jgi:hypothetical protein